MNDILKTQEKILIDGPVGALETLILQPGAGDARGIAVLNHPNPLYGGTHNNKVIQTAAKSLKNKGYVCYLPNLRGVGESAGTHDYGRGEMDDVLSVWAYARRAHPELSHRMLLGGFSFGGYVSAHVAHRVDCERLLLIGAAVTKYDPPAPAVPNIARTLVIHGAADEVISLQAILDWCAPQDLPVTVLADAGHFFHGKLPFLSTTITRFLDF